MRSAKSMSRNAEYFRDLIVEIVKVELKTRHFQKLLGPLWWLLEPVLYALMFFFITTVMFNSGGGAKYLLFILTMTIVWRWFSRSVDTAPSILLGYQAILKQTRFPATIIPFASASVEVVFFLFGFTVLLMGLLIGGVGMNWTLVFLPFIMMTQFIFTLSLMAFLSAAGIFIRDLGQVVYLFTGLWFYISPGIYPIERVPERLRPIYDMNPFATLFPAYKAVLLDGEIPNVQALSILLGCSGVLLFIGFAFFNRLKRGFYKVL